MAIVLPVKSINHSSFSHHERLPKSLKHRYFAIVLKANCRKNLPCVLTVSEKAAN
jgi:hypothetical protein